MNKNSIDLSRRTHAQRVAEPVLAAPDRDARVRRYTLQGSALILLPFAMLGLALLQSVRRPQVR